LAANILDSITELYHSLTRSEKKLADYIFSNPTDTQYLSISTLAEYSEVSEATITRFCRKLGLSGYNDFKLAIAKSDRLSDMGEPANTSHPITSDDSLRSIFQKLYASNVSALNETYEFLSEKDIQKAVDLLADADRVYCFGHGGSSVMAMEAWARFSTASSNFIHIADSHMQMMTVAQSTPQDVILFFSYSGSTRDMEDLLTTARANHTPVILITHFPRSQAAVLSDVVLLCGYNESPLQSGSIAAKIGQMFLIDCLFFGFCRKNPELRSKTRTITAEAITRKLL
jgi:DNA-binding MurR/RpiR family transcriptional regulator